MAENALMVEQTAVLQAELDRCSTDLDSRTKEAASFRDEAERATEKWRALEGGEGQWREARRRLGGALRPALDGHGAGPGATRRIEGGPDAVTCPELDR